MPSDRIQRRIDALLDEAEVIERLKATGNVTLAATGAGVARQHAYRTRNRSKAFRRLWDEALEQAVDLLEGEDI